MYGDWRGTLWPLLVTFCVVIIRCTDTFWSPCISLSSHFCQIWTKFGAADLYKMLLHVCELHENRRREALALLWAPKKFHLRVYRESVWHSESKDGLHKDCFVTECTICTVVPHCINLAAHKTAVGYDNIACAHRYTLYMSWPFTCFVHANEEKCLCT
jgi:hypothetical protein